MVICVIIAIISALTGIANAYFNSREIAKLGNELDMEKTKTKVADEKVISLVRQLDKNKEVAESLNELLKAKELAVAESSNEELKGHIKILRGSINRLKNPLENPSN